MPAQIGRMPFTTEPPSWCCLGIGPRSPSPPPVVESPSHQEEHRGAQKNHGPQRGQGPERRPDHREPDHAQSRPPLHDPEKKSEENPAAPKDDPDQPRPVGP